MKTVVADISLLGKIASYIEILVKDPSSTVFVSLSDAYRKLGLVDEALATARKGVEAVPGYVPGLVTLGRLLAEQRDWHAASEYFGQALALEPESLPALTGLARVHMLAGEHDAARVLLHKAGQVAPQDPFVAKLQSALPPRQEPLKPAAETSAAMSAPVTVASDDVSEKETELQTGDAKPPIATATLADIYIQQGFPEKALKVYFDLLQAEPDNGEILRRYQELRQRLHGVDDEQATAALTTTVSTGKKQLVDIYYNWLNAISARRAHVR